ncbi:MAG TPA: HlyD family efflux transporter periplasmic adaptor subunit [Bacteroidales bacterium]|nr:HlyD family efflux transporter periplasmic adaptor subunit [Bacteroidales bacterium]
MKRNTIIAGVFSALVMTVLFSCGQKTESSASETTETPVTLTPAAVRHMVSSTDLPATSIFLKRSTLKATVSGTIRKASVMQGDKVVENQVLFTMKTKESMALENSEKKDTTLSFSGLIEIKSPGNGIISSVSHQPGDYVQEGDELAVISEKNSLVFILDVPVELEKYMALNKHCLIDLPDSKPINGTITGKLSEMDLQTQTLKYMIKPSEIADLPENLIANVRLITSEKDSAIVLPRKAILSNETMTEFWVMKLINDSTAVKVPVKKGIENIDEVEITDPVFTPADRILLTGNYGLPDTARVFIIH